MRLLLLLPHTRSAAGCRYRIHQYIPYLESNGIECHTKEFVDESLYSILYSADHKLRKAYLTTLRCIRRFRDLVGASTYDGVFIYRECFPFGPPFIEQHLKRLGIPIIYDFDDAIYLPERTALRAALRRPEKTGNIVFLADRVVVSNEHLRRFCTAYNRNVTVIPTSVDTDIFRPAVKQSTGSTLKLGWIGSHSTAKYLHLLRPALTELASRHSLELHLVGASLDYAIPGMLTIQRKWSPSTEVADFQELDIGLYPLEDSVWELGKAGFKAIQYMAVGVPCVSSRVGVVSEIVEEGKSGFLASDADEWVAKLEQLILSPDLRYRFSVEGRKTIEDRYSTAKNAPRLLAEIRQLVTARSPQGVPQ